MFGNYVRAAGVQSLRLAAGARRDIQRAPRRVSADSAGASRRWSVLITLKRIGAAVERRRIVPSRRRTADELAQAAGRGRRRRSSAGAFSVRSSASSGASTTAPRRRNGAVCRRRAPAAVIWSDWRCARWQMRVACRRSRLADGEASSRSPATAKHERPRSTRAASHRRLTPSSRSSCAIVSSGARWWTVAIPSSAAGARLIGGRRRTRSRPARARCARRRARRSPAPACASRPLRRSPRRRTARPADLAGSAWFPRSSTPARCGSRAARARRTAVEHLLVGAGAGEQPVDQTRRRHARAARRTAARTPLRASVPVSRPRISSRHSRRSGTRRLIASGSSPSSSQKARNDSNTSLVSTPPQSTSSPRYSRRQRPCSRDRKRAIGDLDHARRRTSSGTGRRWSPTAPACSCPP